MLLYGQTIKPKYLVTILVLTRKDWNINNLCILEPKLPFETLKQNSPQHKLFIKTLTEFNKENFEMEDLWSNTY
jgi:hypothetical protein